MRATLLTLICIPLFIKAMAQTAPAIPSSDSLNSSPRVIIDLLVLQGNHKTKETILRREMDIKEGDTLNSADLPAILELNRQRLFNTGLFVYVDITSKNTHDNYIEIFIHMKERFYTYPLPILELADRNFNEWWQQRNHDWDRINVGVDLVRKNVRGRNETLRAKIQFGFTHKYELSYAIPYLDKKQKLGLQYWISYSTNKQVAYRIDNHTLTYTELLDEKLRKRFYTAAALSFRSKFYQRHYLTLTYFNNKISDTIAQLNPYYYLDGKTRQQYFSLRYTFIHDRRDIQYYPLKGYYARGDAEKLGLGGAGDINTFILRVEYAQYIPLSSKIFLALGARQKISTPSLQPFANYTAFGYNLDYVSGYELYVINGQHLSLGKANIKYRIFQVRKELSELKFKQVNTIPFAIYFKLHADAGYVWDFTKYNPNPWANTFLMGGGAGLDFVSYYDMVFRLEYSYTLEHQGGVFIHMKAGI